MYPQISCRQTKHLKVGEGFFFKETIEIWTFMILALSSYHRSKITSAFGNKSIFRSHAYLKYQKEKIVKENKYLYNLGIPSNFEVSSVYFNIHLSSTSGWQEGRILWFKECKTYNQENLNLNPRLANCWLFIFGLTHKPLSLSFNYL